MSDNNESSSAMNAVHSLTFGITFKLCSSLLSLFPFTLGHVVSIFWGVGVFSSNVEVLS